MNLTKKEEEKIMKLYFQIHLNYSLIYYINS